MSKTLTRPSKDPLALEDVNQRILRYHKDVGAWPSKRSDSTGSRTWGSIDQRLRQHNSSLSQRCKELGKPVGLPWTKERAIELIRDYHARTGKWPNSGSGYIEGDGRIWAALDSALKLHHASSISQLCGELGRPGLMTLDDLDQIILSYNTRLGKWPVACSEVATNGGPTWNAISLQLTKHHQRSLAQQCAQLGESLGGKSRGLTPQAGKYGTREGLSNDLVDSLVLEYKNLTGKWPHTGAGVIGGLTRTWLSVDKWLNRHCQQSLSKRCMILGKKKGTFSLESIGAFILSYHEKTRKWPHSHLGAVEGDGRTWAAVDAYLKGQGTNLSQLCSNLGRTGGKYLPEGSIVEFPELTLRPGQQGFDRELLRKTLHLPTGLVLDFAKKHGISNEASLVSQRGLLKKIENGYDHRSAYRDYVTDNRDKINRSRRTRHARDLVERPEKVAQKRAASVEYYNSNREEQLVHRREWYTKNAEKMSSEGLLLRATQRELYLWKSAKDRARRSELDFDIEPSDIEVPEFCPVLGIKLFVPSQSEGHKKVRPDSATLDRIDPRRGYVKGNVWVISFRANTIKSDATPNELKVIASSYSERLGEGQSSVRPREQSRATLLRVSSMRRAAKRRAGHKGLDFNLEVTDIEIPESCPLLGVRLHVPRNTGLRELTKPNSATLDRINSAKGYVKGNVWVVSHRANTIKSDATPEELRKVAEAVERRLKSIRGQVAD